MISIPVSGTIFVIFLIVGGLLWAVELSQKATRAAKRAGAAQQRRRAVDTSTPPQPPYGQAPGSASLDGPDENDELR